MNLATGDVRHLWIEQRCEGAQNAAFRLSAQAEKNEIMAREDRVHDLRDYRVIVANDTRKYLAAFAQPRHQVLAQLIFYPSRSEMLGGERTLT